MGIGMPGGRKPAFQQPQRNQPVIIVDRGQQHDIGIQSRNDLDRGDDLGVGVGGNRLGQQTRPIA